ncbi:MAG: metallophosphoesterase [Rhodospirillaceae bacterium]|nr:metallophosphoesterase [Rhodospirillaceae bacterium]
MKILMCGDVMARAGREAVSAHLPALRQSLGLDFVLLNGENAAGGFGITGDICRALYETGVDAITLGNHAWDQREAISYIEGDPKLIRPANCPPGTPGRGSGLYTLADGRKVLVVQVICRLFMDAMDDPFAAVERELAPYRLGATVDAVIVDIHGEASSEKQALGRFVDGRASLAAGTHTHVPTADHMILPRGTAYMTDIGMCGAYNSIIGMDIDSVIERFVRKMPGKRWEPVMDDGTLAAVYIETDDATGLATKVAPVRLGGVLSQASVG